MLLDFFDPTKPLNIAALLIITFAFFVSMVVSYFSTAMWLYVRYTKNKTNDPIIMQDKDPAPGQLKHEIFWSMMTIVQYTVLILFLLLAWRAGLFPNLYLLPWEQSWGYFFFSILLLVLIQDVLFYFSHRALHSKKLAKYHAVHHRSKVPTPFAIYSFHPVEGFIHMIRIPVIMWLLPVNLFAILIAEGFISNVINAYSHMNFEPRGLPKPLRWLHKHWAATSAFHNLHHKKGNGNYGFYLRLWDDKLGTTFPGTDEELDRVQKEWSK